MYITNCRLISPGVDQVHADILIHEQFIISAGFPDRTSDHEHPGEEIDGTGLMALPGFFDIHTHGAQGHDMCDDAASVDTINRIAQAKIAEGVTSYFPTTLSIDRDRLNRSMTAAAAFGSHAQRPTRFHGVHIEGPYINPQCAGAQNPAHIRPPDLAEFDELRAIAPVAKISVAPEMPGAIDFIAAVRERQITVSLAHTAATYAQFLEAKAAGANHLTHYCNQMAGLHHREIGLVGAGLLDDDVMLEVICDGIHLCPDMIRLIFKCVPIERLMLVTDSMAASGLGDGNFDLGGQEVVVKDGQARLEGGALAGSTLRFNQGLRRVHEVTGLPLKDLVATTSWNQARSLNIPDIGKLEPHFLADIVLLDEDFKVVRTIVNGK